MPWSVSGGLAMFGRDGMVCRINQRWHTSGDGYDRMTILVGSGRGGDRRGHAEPAGEAQRRSRLRCGAGLGDVFTGFAGDGDVRVVILTGAGGHFSAGADISEFPAMRSDPEGRARLQPAGHAATLAIRDLPQPTIAAVHGYVRGRRLRAGAGVRPARGRCDDADGHPGRAAVHRLRLAGYQLLLRAVGLAGAKLVLYSGRYLPAARLPGDGPDRRRASEQGALPGAHALARELLTRAPLSQRGSKVVLEATGRGEVSRAPPRSPRHRSGR